MGDDRRRERQRDVRRLMRALRGESETIMVTETGDVSEHRRDHLERISPSTSYRALVELRQQEYAAVLSQRRERYATSEEFGNQGRREYEAYSRTLEGVADRLDLSRLTGENETLAHVIYETVMRLTDEVREFVGDHVVFLSSAWGYAVRGMDWSDKWLIVLAPDLPEADATGIVAHQIAHAWRGHGAETYGYTAAEEREACAIAQTWGFIGSGTVFEPPPDGVRMDVVTYMT